MVDFSACYGTVQLREDIVLCGGHSIVWNSQVHNYIYTRIYIHGHGPLHPASIQSSSVGNTIEEQFCCFRSSFGILTIPTVQGYIPPMP